MDKKDIYEALRQLDGFRFIYIVQPKQLNDTKRFKIGFSNKNEFMNYYNNGSQFLCFHFSKLPLSKNKKRLQKTSS